jgi:hypothetical protein
MIDRSIYKKGICIYDEKVRWNLMHFRVILNSHRYRTVYGSLQSAKLVRVQNLENSFLKKS